MRGRAREKVVSYLVGCHLWLLPGGQARHCVRGVGKEGARGHGVDVDGEMNID